MTTILDTQTLTLREWRAIGEIAKAGEAFQPLAMRENVGPIVAKRLVTMGIVEMGASSPGIDRMAFPIGYRLSTLGRMMLRRGRKAPERKVAAVAVAGGPKVVVVRRPRLLVKKPA